MALTINLEPGMTLAIGEVSLRLIEKSGRRARLEITADKNRFPVSVARRPYGRTSNTAQEGHTKEV
jgi:hypothetical protein